MTTIYELIEKEKYYFRLLEIVRLVAYNTDPNEHVTCKARELLKEMERKL
jgi:hypothetical protein